MDISFLPLELIEEVAKYLSLEDLVSCSKVNKQWNRAFDNNRIWDLYCTFPKKYSKKQVIQRKSSSKHFFGGCKSKKHVFRELQVEKNLIQGKYALTHVNIGSLFCDNLVDLVDDDGNHLLFISCSLGSDTHRAENYHRIEVWDMTHEEPVKLESKVTPFTRTIRLLDSQMKIFKNKLYYVVDNVCTIFEFGRPEYKLILLFEIICPRGGVPRGRTIIVCTPNMVLGFLSSIIHSEQSAEPWVHVWGEDSSLLYKSYSTIEEEEMQAMMLENDEEVFSTSPSSVNHSGTSDNVLVVCSDDRGEFETMSVLLFSLKTFQYTTLFVKTNARNVYCELVNETVVLFYHQLYFQAEITDIPDVTVPKLICYSTDGNMIFDLELKRRRNMSIMLSHYSMVTANEGREVVMLDSRGYVTVFDVFQQKEISTFKVGRGRGRNIGTFLKGNLIIVQEEREKKTTVAVWDFKRGERLYDFCELLSRPPLSKVYRFSFIKSFRSPSKIFAIKDPSYSFARRCDGEAVMISFL